MVGIDRDIERIITHFESNLWTDKNCEFYGRVYPNEKGDGIIPEVYDTTTNDYKEVLLDDKLDCISFFYVDPTRTLIDADVSIIFAINVKNLYPSYNTRETERAMRDVNLELQNAGVAFNVENVITGINAVEEFTFTSQHKMDMHPFYLFRLECEANYDFNAPCEDVPTPIKYTLATSVDGNTGGIISPNTGQYNAGETVRVITAPDPDYELVETTVNGVATTDSWFDLVMNEGKDVVAYFQSIYLKPNDDIIQINSIDDIETTGVVWSSLGGEGMQSINLTKTERIRQTCLISEVSIYIDSAAPFDGIVLQIWRKDGTTYDLVSEIDLTSKITTPTAINTVILTNPIQAQEGDFVSWRFISNVGGLNATRVNSAPANSIRWTNNELQPVDFDWESQNGSAFRFNTHLKSSAPLLVGIGDSIMEGAPLTSSMLAVSETVFDIDKSWTYKLSQLDSKYTYQNVGIGGEGLVDIEARFNRDVVLIKPRLVVIDGGVNDIYEGVTKATFLEKYTSIFDTCVIEEIIPVVWKIMPWTNGSNARMQARDEWNSDLVDLFNSYAQDTWIIIDWDSDLGQFRPGGDPGNLWDIKPEYLALDGFGVHYNEDGNAKIAEVMYNTIEDKFN